MSSRSCEDPVVEVADEARRRVEEESEPYSPPFPNGVSSEFVLHPYPNPHPPSAPLEVHESSPQTSAGLSHGDWRGSRGGTIGSPPLEDVLCLKRKKM